MSSACGNPLLAKGHRGCCPGSQGARAAMLEGGVEMGLGQRSPIFIFTIPSGAQLLVMWMCP